MIRIFSSLIYQKKYYSSSSRRCQTKKGWLLINYGSDPCTHAAFQLLGSCLFTRSLALSWKLIEKQMEGRCCTWGNKYLSILIINQLRKNTFTPSCKNSFFSRSFTEIHMWTPSLYCREFKTSLSSFNSKKKTKKFRIHTRLNIFDVGSAAGNFLVFFFFLMSWILFSFNHSWTSRRWSFDLEIIIQAQKLPSRLCLYG